GGLASNSEITQAFKIQNATVNLDSAGNANVFFGDKQAKNQNPDFVIPRPYLLDKNAVRKDLDWKFEKTTNLLSVTFAMPKESFPIALDPSILKTDKVVATFSGKKISMHAPVCGDVGYTVTDIDSNVYNAVLIGTQCWLKENMMTTKYPDGTSINCGTNACLGTNTWSGADNGYYAYPPNIGNTAEESLANIQTNKLGFVYQWSAVMKGSITPGAQGICPTGWHVPTHDEYTTLERAVCTSGTCVTDFPYDISTMGWRGINEGSKLSQYTSGGTNSSGFSGILAGNRNTFGSFSNRTSLAFFWSSSPIGGTAWYRYLSSGYASVYRLQFQGGRFFCSLPEELILRSRIVFDSFVFHSTLNFEALA
ncbi:MAG: fibrobacter succinogenes major paralogous domain-containing protein, partial [Candidatus Moraniibacteriota bacterium]